jgi:hypothetical protein
MWPTESGDQITENCLNFKFCDYGDYILAQYINVYFLTFLETLQEKNIPKSIVYFM